MVVTPATYGMYKVCVLLRMLKHGRRICFPSRLTWTSTLNEPLILIRGWSSSAAPIRPLTSASADGGRPALPNYNEQ